MSDSGAPSSYSAVSGQQYLQTLQNLVLALNAQTKALTDQTAQVTALGATMTEVEKHLAAILVQVTKIAGP